MGEILELAQPLVVERTGDGLERVDALAADLGGEAAKRLREGFVAAAPVDVTATPLRERLARGEGRDEVPPAVWEYLDLRGIYRGDGDRSHGAD